jgi:uncharacterized sporulation protein YeaH/YhbH (DUF444 family)
VAYVIIDRRKNDKNKSSTNRSRYVRRVREQVKEAVKDIIRDGSIQDSLNGGAKKINIKKKGLTQPEFQHDRSGGIRDIVRPGNKEYEAGDRFPKPPGGQGAGGKGKGSPDGEGNDEFEFTLSRQEFLDLFFEDLELPDMIKKDMVSTETYTMKRAGFSVDGNPSRLNILRSMKFAKSRRIALKAPKKKEIRALEEELALLQKSFGFDNDTNGEIAARIEFLIEEIARLYRKKKAIPFVDDMDLRYNRWEKFPNPTTQAVMFGLLDVSASMDEWKKEMAKRFFILMLLFLQHNYERVDIVWIRHHTTAKEVDEDTFFHSQESGGTVVSTAYELMMQIIKERYPLSQWNVFGTHISDGDNYSPDNTIATEILSKQILPASQYFAYVEVKKGADSQGTNSDLWPIFKPIQDVNKNFVMSVIGDVNQIYPMFRKLFEKRK